MIINVCIFTYDAFVCHNQDDPEDTRLVQDLIEKLEGRRGLRLYVPGRDDISSASEYINTAGEIEKSCRTVIIVLSRSYLQSRFFVFQERFAYKLSTGERRARMIAVIRERGTVVPYSLDECNTLDYNNMNEINWVLLTSSINLPITRTTYRTFGRNRNMRDFSIPYPAGAHENTAPKELTPSRNVQRLADPNGSPDHNAPMIVVRRSSAPIAPAIRTDLQLLQTERKIREPVQEGGDINVPAPRAHIETSLVHEDDTEPKHVLPDEQTDSMSRVHLEYQNQPTTGIHNEQNTRDALLLQNAIPTEPDEQTTLLTPQLLTDNTSSTTLSVQLISEPSSSLIP